MEAWIMKTEEAVLMISMLFYIATMLLEWFYFRPKHLKDIELRKIKVKEELVKELFEDFADRGIRLEITKGEV
jgi:hypothetical protein